MVRCHEVERSVYFVFVAAFSSSHSLVLEQRCLSGTLKIQFIE